MSDAGDARGDESGEGDAEGGPTLCDFCRLPCPKEPVTVEHESTVYEFCSDACREAMAESERTFTEYHGFRRFRTGVSGLDQGLPQGVPRNSFVLLSGDEGSREMAVLAELVWRTLRRDEPAAIVTFTEPPTSVVEQFLSLDWNVLPYLESGQFHVLDCFTYRVSNREMMFDRMNEWNRHLHRVTADATQTVRDPSDASEIQNKLDNCLETLRMSDRGIVAIDSLTEFGALVQPVQAYDFVKDIRADVCKGRFVPVFAGANVTGDEVAFPHDLGYAVDGIVDLRLDGSIVKDTLIKRVRIRKMRGVLAIPEWTAYEFTAGTGMVTFDPRAEMDETYEGGGREEAEGGERADAEGDGRADAEGDGRADVGGDRERTEGDAERAGTGGTERF